LRDQSVDIIYLNALLGVANRMSVAFTKEEANEATAAFLPERPISPHPNLVTATGLAKLDAALALAKDAVALAQTNADLKTDRSAMARAARDFRYFAARRANAQLSEPVGDPDIVLFGRRVTFRRDDGRTQSFRIVGEDEADAAQGTISYVSPMAKVLLGKRVGDIAMLKDSELEIISVSGDSSPDKR
jgi:transcription elongation GreA/GreB family factor